MAGVAVHIAMTDYTGEPDLLFFNYNNGQSDTSVAACTHSVNGNGTWQEKACICMVSKFIYIFGRNRSGRLQYSGTDNLNGLL